MKKLVFGMLLLTTPVLAETITTSVTDVTAISDGEGSSRILFRADVSAMENVALRRALLRWNAAGSGERVVLQVHPVTTAWDADAADWTTGWTRPGGDFVSELYGRREVAAAGGEVVVDVTGIFKEILEHGYASQGFVLTVDPREGAGLDAGSLERLGDLSRATLEVQYRKVPPLPASRRG